MPVSDFELVDLLDEDILYGNDDSEFGLDLYEEKSGSSNMLKTTGLVGAGVVIGILGTHLFKMLMGSGNKHSMGAGHMNQMGAGHMSGQHMGAGHMNQMGAGHMSGQHMGAGHMNIFGAGHMGGHHK